MQPLLGMDAARMLVVDDDPRNRRILEGFLRQEGYAVRSAKDGPSALETVGQWLPDVVLLDVMMPGMNGYEVLSVLKSNERTRACQVMLVTALDSVPDRIAGLDTGADDYVAKPVRRDEFLAKVRALLRARTLLVDLEHAREELARRNRELELKRTLAETLVHDLKSPLAAIIGNLELLERKDDGSNQKVIERSRRGAQRMLQMILNLLDVEELEHGELVPRVDVVDATALAFSTVDELRVVAEQGRVRLLLIDEGRAPVAADPHLLRRVLENLISNAIAYSPVDGTVQVGVAQRPEGIEITVRDEGPGIPEESRESVFEKYHRLDGSRSGGASVNRGLGLTFCRMAVEAHGGAIWVDSSEQGGGGALFRVLLPEAPESQSAEFSTVVDPVSGKATPSRI